MPSFIHDRTLLPRHLSLLKKTKECNPCVRYEMSPMSQVAHQQVTGCFTKSLNPQSPYAKDEDFVSLSPVLLWLADPVFRPTAWQTTNAVASASVSRTCLFVPALRSPRCRSSCASPCAMVENSSAADWPGRIAMRPP